MAATIAAVLVGHGCAGVIGATNSKSSSPTPPSGSPQPQLAVSPSSATFQNVVAGSSRSQAVTISNGGTANATISQINVSGAGFSVTGVTLPAYVAAGHNTTFNIVFSPTTPGNMSGSVAVVSDASNSPLMIAASGDAVAAAGPSLTSSANALNFGSVIVGSTTSLTATLTNTGSANVSISALTAVGSGLSASGVAANSVLTPGQSATLTVVYAPAAAGNLSGSVSISSNTPNSPLTIAATGNAAAPTPALTATSSSLNFGSVLVGGSSVLGATLTNTGTANATISGVSITGSGFSVAGISSGTVLMPGQSAPLSVTFAPQATGNFPGSITISSNAPTLTIGLVGIGGTASSHAVALTWDPSTSDVTGYNIYRAPADGSTAYQKLNTVAQSQTQYTDQNILAGQEYMYAVTAVDSDGVESDYSDPAVADVP